MTSATAQGRAFQGGKENIEEVIKQIIEFWADGIKQNKLPLPDKKVDWNLWLVKPNAWFKHHSLVFESIEFKGSFTVGLLVDNTNSVVPNSEPFDEKLLYSKEHYKLLGVIKSTTANSLYKTALDCLKTFGNYNEVTNNCQDYCKVIMRLIQSDFTCSMLHLL